MFINKTYFLQMFVRLVGHEKCNNWDVKKFGVWVKGQSLYRVFILIINKYY